MHSIVPKLFDIFLIIRDTLMSLNHDSDLPMVPATTLFEMLNGSSSIIMPSLQTWSIEYAQDPECKLIL